MRLRGFPCLGPAMPGCFGSAMQSRLIVWWILCERRKRNAPGCWNPRAFAWPREIGVTDLRDARDQSMVVVPKVFRSAGRCMPRNSHARRPASRLGDGVLAAMGKACVMG